jgi:adenylate cyclase
MCGPTTRAWCSSTTSPTAEEETGAGGGQAGPVIFRDGDVYGRTVNVASRIADQARAGEILTSHETVERVNGGEVSFEQARSVELQGVERPVTLYRVVGRA